MFKTIATAALTAIVVVLLSGLVGGNQPGVGGDTRFPNSTLGAQGLRLSNGSATTTLNVGKVCIAASTTAGVTQFAFFTATGLATSSTSCL